MTHICGCSHPYSDHAPVTYKRMNNFYRHWECCECACEDFASQSPWAMDVPKSPQVVRLGPAESLLLG